MLTTLISYADTAMVGSMGANATAAVTTFVGQSLGANKPDLAVRYIRRTLLLANVVMVIAGVGLFIFADPIISIFTPDERVIVLAGNCLRILAFIQRGEEIAHFRRIQRADFRPLDVRKRASLAGI